MSGKESHMSNNEVNESSQSVIDRAGKHHWGYNVDQVDEFLQHAHDLYEEDDPGLTQEDIQLTSFDLEKNGYVIGQVDATLIRLEKAVVDKHTSYEIAHRGRQAWDDDTKALVRTLEERAEAPDGERFKRGLPKHPSYDVKQVDLLVRQAWTRITSLMGVRSQLEPETGSENINASQVSNVIFTQRKAKHGYDESSVDAYLNRIIQVLTRMESVTRLGLPLPGMQPDRESAQSGSLGSAAAPAFAPRGSAFTDEENGSLAGLVQHTTDQAQAEAEKQSDGEETGIFDHMMDQPYTHPQESENDEPSPADRPVSYQPSQQHSADESAPAPSPAPSFAPVQKPVRSSSIPSIPPLPQDERHTTETPVSTPSGSVPAPVPAPSDATDSVTSTDSADSVERSAAQQDQNSPKSDDAYLSRLMNTSVTPTGSFDIPSLTLGSFASDTGDDSRHDSQSTGEQKSTNESDADHLDDDQQHQQQGQ
jgi:DivIVA domain-containing protein